MGKEMHPILGIQRLIAAEANVRGQKPADNPYAQSRAPINPDAQERLRMKKIYRADVRYLGQK